MAYVDSYYRRMQMLAATKPPPTELLIPREVPQPIPPQLIEMVTPVAAIPREVPQPGKLPLGAQITGVFLTREGYRIEYIMPQLVAPTPPPPEPAPLVPPTEAEIMKLLPKGAEFVGITETPEGYQIQYMMPAPPPPTPRPPPKDVFEWIGQRWEEITHPKPFYVAPTEKGPVVLTKFAIMGPPKEPLTPTLIRTVEDIQKFFIDIPSEPTFRVTPTGIKYEKLGETLAKQLEVTMVPIGMVRTVEATLGRQPSVVGATISTAISPLLGKPTTEPLEQYWRETKEHPLLMPGELIGEFLMAKYIWGPAISEAWKGVKWITPEIIKQPITRAVKFGRVPKAVYRAKLWWIEHKPWVSKARYISRGEVALTTLAEPISLKQLQASQLAWQLTQFPRTGGVWLRQVGFAPVKAKVLPHLIYRAGKISIGYLREPLIEEPYWQRGLLPFVTQTQVTRMGIIPYIPRTVTVTGKKAVSQLAFGLGLTALAKTLTQPRRKRREFVPSLVTPKVWETTFAYEREKFRPLTLEREVVKEKERVIAVPDITQALVQQQKALVKTIQKQKQILVPTIPTPTILKPPAYPPYWRRRGPRETFGRRFEAMFGKWYYRRHPIPTAQELARQMMGAKPRKKPKKKKAKKKRAKRTRTPAKRKRKKRRRKR